MRGTWLFAASLLLLITGLDAQAPGGCNFSPAYQNTLIYGGMANPASSEEACKTACRMNSSCQGIDWAPGNIAGQQCFLQSKTTDKNTNAPGVTHYDYSCNGTTGTTMVPPPPPPSRGCKTIRDASPDTNSIGGYNVPELNILLCITACQQIGPCLGFDLDPKTGCWFHFDVNSFPQKFYQQYVTQFAFTRCPEEGISSCTPGLSNGIQSACASVCYPKWTRLEDTAGTGGQVVTTAGFRNASACLEYCVRRSDCVGVDYSDQPGSQSVCTFYNQFSSMNNTVNRPFVAQYRIENRCSRNCTTYYDNKDNIRYRLYKPMVVTNVPDQQECFRRCRVSETCQAYQFNKSGPGSPSCTHADNFFEGTAVNDSNVFTGLYRENCNTTMPPPTPPMPVPGGCNFSQPYQNTLIYGGMANPASSEEACKNACRMNSSCQGIDWAPGNTAGQQCFLQSKTTDKNTNAPGVTHYDYSCNGSGSGGGGGSTTLPGNVFTSTTMPTTNCWAKNNDTLIYGGTQNPATSLNDCFNACIALGKSACPGIDWANPNPVGSQCFLQKTTMGKSPGPGVDHYDYTC